MTEERRDPRAEYLAAAALFVDASGHSVLAGDHPAGGELVGLLQTCLRAGRARQCSHVKTAAFLVWLPGAQALGCHQCASDALLASPVPASCSLCGIDVDADSPPWWTAVWDRLLSVAIICDGCSAPREDGESIATVEVAGSGVLGLSPEHPVGAQLADGLARQRPALGLCAHLDDNAAGGTWWQGLPAIVCRACADVALQRLPPGKSMPGRPARCSLCGGAEPVGFVATLSSEIAVLAAVCARCRDLVAPRRGAS